MRDILDKIISAEKRSDKKIIGLKESHEAAKLSLVAKHESALSKFESDFKGSNDRIFDQEIKLLEKNLLKKENAFSVRLGSKRKELQKVIPVLSDKIIKEFL